MKTYKINTRDSLMVFALIAISTIPFFKSSIGVGFVLCCIAYSYRQFFTMAKAETIIILIIVLLLEIYHESAFRNYEGWVTRQIMFFFFSAAFITYYLKLNFLVIYVRIMYLLTLVSFIFFVSYYVSPAMVTGLANSMPAIFVKTSTIYNDVYKQINPIIYNFDHNFYKGRNNGPFWEPTVFASLLLIGQIYNILLNKVLLNKIGIVFTVGIITTFSTTVFVAYFILIASYFLLNGKLKFMYKVSLLISSIALGLYLFSSLSFLEEKINAEILETENNMNTRGDSRVASALLDLSEVSSDNIYLLLGKGTSDYSRIGGADKSALRNCGLTGLLVQWGLPFFILYVVLLYYSFYQMAKHYQVNTLFAFSFTFLILLVSFSEVFFDLPLFHALIFFGFVVKRFYRKKHYIPTVKQTLSDKANDYRSFSQTDLKTA